MTRITQLRTSVLLVALLAGGMPVHAAGQGKTGRQAGFFASLWRSIVELVPAVAELADSLKPETVPPPPQSDLGSGMDPDG